MGCAGSGLRFALALAAAGLLGGCATFLGETNDAVTLDTDPSGASLTITEKGGREVFRGQSPAQVTLDVYAGYFSGQTFDVVASKPGYATAHVTLDTELCNWYLWGNILVGGLIGWVIVDPLTGAMWDLPEKPPVIVLSPAPGTVPPAGPGTE